MKIVVLDAATLGRDLDLTILDTVGEVVIYDETPQELIPERITDADVIVANKARLNRESLFGATRLKLIAETATGYDNIDLAYCREKQIGIANIAGYSTNSVVQVTVATVLSLATRLDAYRTFVADGSYSCGSCFNRLEPVFHELAGKTWGIIGYGNIGKSVARIADALGCRVITYTRTVQENVTCVDLETLCRESDVITIHVPLSDTTRNLIDADMLSKMKQSVILVNEARGAVVDEAAVAKAALAGDIFYGCDVYATEPFGVSHPYNAIKQLENVCLTPHMAWGAYEARSRCINEVVENIRAFIAGKRRNRVD